MLPLVSRTYRKRSGAVIAVAVVMFGFYATDPLFLGTGPDGTYLADSDTPIVTELPEIEVVAQPIEWK